MEFFTYFYEDEIKRFFYQKPQNFNKYANRELLSYGLGATLYMPATRPNIHQEILSKKHEGLTSLVIDLEDAVGDKEVLGAESMLILELLKLDGEINRGYLSFVDLPLMFIRVRSLEQFKRVTEQLGDSIKLLTGVVLPKFTATEGEELLMEVRRLHTSNHPFYAMPILETAKIMQKETRMEEL
ncbi:MAG: HpcH/HpaI aldolase/citrate lyase family protein, partial [Bacillus sp. (in: firmicutes)]